MLMGSLCVMAALLWSIELLRRQDPFARFNQRFAEAGLGNVAVRFEQVELTLRDEQMKWAEVKADRIDLSRDRIEWRVINIRESQLYEEGELFAKATAKLLLYQTSKQQAQLSGNPKITILKNRWLQDQPMTARVSEIHWDTRARKITAPSETHLQWKEGRATVKGFTLDLSNRQITLGAGALFMQAQPPGSENDKKRELKITYSGAKGIKDVLDVDDLTVTDEDTVMKAKRASYNEKTRYVMATGSLSLTDPKVELTGDKMEAWLREKRALLSNKVQLLVKPKEENIAPPNTDQEETTLQSARRYPVVVTCDQIEYFYRKKIAYLKGNLKAVQKVKDGKTRTLTAQSAEYDQKKEILILKGNVVLEHEDGRFNAPEVIVSVKEGDEWIQVKGGSGVVFVEDEEEEK